MSDQSHDISAGITVVEAARPGARCEPRENRRIIAGLTSRIPELEASVERTGEKPENRLRVLRSYPYPDAGGGPPPDAQRPQEQRW